MAPSSRERPNPSSPLRVRPGPPTPLGATILAILNGKLSYKVLREVSRSTLNTTGYIVGIFLAANFFAFVLRRYGGDEIVEALVLSAFDDPYLTVLFIEYSPAALEWLGLPTARNLVVRLTLVLALIAGLSRFLPYLGSPIALAVTAIVAFLQPTNHFGLEPVSYTLLVTIVCLIQDLIMDNLVVPRLLGRQSLPEQQDEKQRRTQGFH